MYPRRWRVANGANLMCVVRTRCGLKAALRGSGRGPWTATESLREDPEGVKVGSLERELGEEGVNSR